MAQGSISAGQTPLLVSDFVNRLEREQPDLISPSASPDFLTPFKTALPAYAKAYTGTYYRVPSQTSAPTSFSAAQYAGANGKLYEETLPADCIDAGVLAFEFAYGSSGLVDLSTIVNEDESLWVTTSANTTTAYWQQNGRKFRAYLPNAYTTTPKWSATYKRQPTFPQVTADAIDAPAEDIGTLYSAWKALVV